MSTSNRKKLERQRKHAAQKAQRQHQSLFSAPQKSKPKKELNYEPSYSNYRETKQYPSVTTSPTADSTAKRESTFYTGDFLIGLTTLHKSNSIPVTRDDDPSIFAKMRRG